MGQLTPDGARAAVATACPNCGSRRTRVICTTPTADGTGTVRRRSCEACNRRWYSYQVPEQVLPDYSVRWCSASSATRSDRVIVTLPTAAA
jgi:transcriptional regulator NrdR family protein